MVKRIVFIFFFLATVFWGCYYLLFASSNTSIHFNASLFENGDLILRKGRSLESFAVYLSDDESDFTHIGIVSKEQSKIYVIHITPSKNNLVKKEGLEDFLSDKNTSRFSLIRPKFDLNTLNSVVGQANLFFKKKYTFDNQYDLKTDTELYCTELVYKAFLNAGITLDVKPSNFNYVLGNHNIIMPSGFTNSSSFKKIIY